MRTPRRVILFTSICGRVTSITPELQSDRDRLASLPSLPRDQGGPVFAEPWQAQAFALAVRLSAQGYFTWKEWAAVLADELKSAADRGHPDDGSSLLRILAGCARTSRDCERTLQSKRDACSQRSLGRRLSTYTPRKTRRPAKQVQLAAGPFPNSVPQRRLNLLSLAQPKIPHDPFPLDGCPMAPNFLLGPTGSTSFMRLSFKERRTLGLVQSSLQEIRGVCVGVAGALHGLNRIGRSPFRCFLFACSEAKQDLRTQSRRACLSCRMGTAECAQDASPGYIAKQQNYNRDPKTWAFVRPRIESVLLFLLTA